MSSPAAPVAALAAAAIDSCMKVPVVETVAFVTLDAVGSAMMLPPERILPRTLSKCSANEPALERRRGTASSKSAGDGRYEVALARDEVSMLITGASAAGLREGISVGFLRDWTQSHVRSLSVSHCGSAVVVSSGEQ